MHNSIGVNIADETKPAKVSGDLGSGLQAPKRRVVALCIEQRVFVYREERVFGGRDGYRCHDAAMPFCSVARPSANGFVTSIELSTRESILSVRIVRATTFQNVHEHAKMADIMAYSRSVPYNRSFSHSSSTLKSR